FAEAFVARPLVELEPVVAVLCAASVADAVVARVIRRRLRGSDHVVAREPVLDRARQRALLDFRAELLGPRERGAHGPDYTRLDPLRLVHLLRDADAEAGESLPLRQLDGRDVDRRRVARVAARDHRIEKRAVADG